MTRVRPSGKGRYQSKNEKGIIMTPINPEEVSRKIVDTFKMMTHDN